MEDQDVHLEVVSENDAMSALLSGVISEYRITYNMVRGYSSDTLIYKVMKAWDALPEDKQIHVLYVGDHEPPQAKTSKPQSQTAINLKLRIRNIYKEDVSNKDRYANLPLVVYVALLDGTSRVVFLWLLFRTQHVRTLDVSGPVQLLKGRHVLLDSLDIWELLDSSPHPLVCGPICVANNRRLGTQFFRSLVNLGQKAVLLFLR